MEIHFAKSKTLANDVDIRKQLNQAFSRYFKEKGISRHANSMMWVKVFGGLLFWIGSYFVVILGGLEGWPLLFVAVFHGLTHLFIPFNISHDASHHAISDKAWVNKLLIYTLETIGVSSFFWNQGHNHEHHGYINVLGKDSNIDGYGMLRFSPDEKPKPAFRFQHWYALFVYALTTINYVTLKDLKNARQYVREKGSVPVKEIAIMLFFKVFYYTYMIVIPALVLDVALWQVLLVYLGIHLMIGSILSLVFLCGHLTEDAYFPQYDTHRSINETWTEHVIRTTGNYGLENPVLTWLVGGINLHLVHHLYPRICHIHYDALSRIAQQVLEENGQTFRYSGSFWQAIGSHFRFLKTMGNAKTYNPALPYLHDN
jgi:linoleoyl-CoA desaturase